MRVKEMPARHEDSSELSCINIILTAWYGTSNG